MQQPSSNRCSRHSVPEWSCRDVTHCLRGRGRLILRIRQLASSQDGYFQIIELEEVSGKDGQDRFAGLELTVTNRFGISKTFVFPSDLPSAGTANKHVTIGPQAMGGYAPPRMDFILPQEFLPTDGGTIDFAGIDRWSFDAIPTDGGVLRRSGEVGPSTVQTFAGEVADCCGPVFIFAYRLVRHGIEFTSISVVEYYNASLGHYFISGSQPDIDAPRIGAHSEVGRFPWDPTETISPRRARQSAMVRRGRTAKFPIQSQPVCRYFIPPGSHFLSASVDECNRTGQQHPEFVLETPAAFYIVLPDLATGECPRDIGYGPIFVHVFPPCIACGTTAPTPTIDTRRRPLVRAEMIDKGWISEGYGPIGRRHVRARLGIGSSHVWGIDSGDDHDCIRRFISSTLAAAGLLFAATTAVADGPIEEIFSNADGKLQFIQLVNITPTQLAGMSLTTSHDGVHPNFRLSGKLANIDSATHSLRRDRLAIAVAATDLRSGWRRRRMGLRHARRFSSADRRNPVAWNHRSVGLW